MSTIISSERLLRGVKRRITGPQNQNLFEDFDILELLDDAMIECVIPEIKSVRQDFFVFKEDILTVADQAEYDIPPRAVGSTLREIKIRSSGGEQLRDLSLINYEDIGVGNVGRDTHSFYFQGDQLVLFPAPQNSNWQIQIWFEMRPSSFVLSSAASQITSITGGDVTVSSVADGLIAGDEIDFIKGKPNHSLRAYNIPLVSVTGNVLTFNEDDIPARLSIGDYIAHASTTPVLQAPVDCYPLLEIVTAQNLLRQLGDFEASRMLDEPMEKARVNLLKEISPRITGENQKIVDRNGLLRGYRYRFNRGYFG